MSTVSDDEAAGSIRRLLWVSRQFMASPGDNLRWTRLEAASAEAQTAVLNNSAMGSCLAQLKELAAWAVYRRTGALGPGMSKDWQPRVGQLHSQLHGCVTAISE